MMYELNYDAYGLFLSLLSLCGVMGLHIYLALVGLDWDYEQGFCYVLMKWSPSMLLFTIASYNVIGSVDLHVFFEWVL